MVSFEMNDRKMATSFTWLIWYPIWSIAAPCAVNILLCEMDSMKVQLSWLPILHNSLRLEGEKYDQNQENICHFLASAIYLSNEIGLGLTGFGIFFSFLGIIFFFDKGLLAMGNILFLSGVMLTIGLKSTMQFFTKPKNYKGTISFGAGFLLVLMGWAIIGMLLEAYGFIVLFSGFWPTLAVFLQRIPILGWLFQQPFVTSLFDRYRGKRVPV